MPRIQIPAVLFLIIVLAACGTSQQASAGAQSAAASVGVSASASPTEGAGPLAGSPLIGTFQTILAANDLGTPTGAWQIRIDEQGMTFVQPDGFEFSPGDVVSVSASEVAFAADPECPTQEGTPTEGTYEWTIDEGLVFTEVADSCRDRAHLLTQAPWEPAA